MVRKTKSTTESAPAPTVTVTVESTPVVVEKKQRKPKAEAVVAPVVEVAPAPAPVVEVAPVVEAAPADVSTLSTKLADFGSKIHQATAILSSMKADFKLLEKTVSRELKSASKSKRNKKVASGNRQPSGFVKPSVISEELIQFLGKEAGTMMSRVEVSKGINAYITANNLKDATSGRQINPDANLAKLLKIGKDEILTYFNLQKYLKIHFIKAVVA